MHRLFFLCLLLLPFSSSHAVQSSLRTDARDSYLVSFQIDEGVRVVGRPQFVIAAGSTATVINSTEGGYSLKARLDSAETGRVRVRSDLYLPVAGKWLRLGQPVITTGVDQATSLTLPGSAGQTVRLRMTVTKDFSGKFANTASFGRNACTAAKLDAWTSAMARTVKIATAAQLTDTDSTQKCCKPCAVMTCCSDGPMCCSDATACPGSGGCCN